jgi:hypothetical protein
MNLFCSRFKLQYRILYQLERKIALHTIITDQHMWVTDAVHYSGLSSVSARPESTSAHISINIHMPGK